MTAAKKIEADVVEQWRTRHQALLTALRRIDRIADDRVREVARSALRQDRNFGKDIT